MVKIICPNCAADLDISPAPIHTCDFCGTAIQVSNMVGPDGQNITGEAITEEAQNTFILKDHYVIRCNYESHEVQAIMEDWITKVPGAPQDFETTATITQNELKFYPLWVGEYKADSNYTGSDNWPNFSHPAHDRAGWFEHVSYYQQEEQGNVKREYQIPLLAFNENRIPKYLRNYRVPTTGKEYFDINHVKSVRGEVVDSAFTFEEAKNKMFQTVLNRQAGEMHKEVVNIIQRNDDVQENGVYYIHFPVYEIKFTYKKKQYEAFVDGSTGRIINIDVPLSTTFRALTIAAGTGHIAIGLGLFISGLSVVSMMFFGVTVGIGLTALGGTSYFFFL